MYWKLPGTLGVDIPTLCYYPYMVPYAACRICCVRSAQRQRLEQNRNGLQLPVWDGLEIITDTPRVDQCPPHKSGNADGETARPVPVLQRLAEQTRITEPRWKTGTNLHCILCGLCVRICDEVVGAHALAFINRGSKRDVSTPFQRDSESCILCGACAKHCPTGHIKMEESKNATSSIMR